MLSKADMSTPFVKATARVCIPAYHCSHVPVSGPFEAGEEWIVEHLLVASPDASALAPSTFVKVDETQTARILVANFSPHPCIIQPGEILGIARNPHEWLDSLLLEREQVKVEVEKLAALVDRLVNLVKTVKLTPLSDPDHKLLGPKMVEVPEMETLPSARMDKLLDISPKAPLELCWKLRELVGCYQEAFGFDDHLGNPQVEGNIDVMLGT